MPLGEGAVLASAARTPPSCTSQLDKTFLDSNSPWEEWPVRKLGHGLVPVCELEGFFHVADPAAFSLTEKPGAEDMAPALRNHANLPYSLRRLTLHLISLSSPSVQNHLSYTLVLVFTGLGLTGGGRTLGGGVEPSWKLLGALHILEELFNLPNWTSNLEDGRSRRQANHCHNRKSRPPLGTWPPVASEWRCLLRQLAWR